MILRLGLPKGSLQVVTIQLFKQAGFNLTIHERSHFPKVDDPEIEVVMMRAQEIPRYVHQGVLDAGLSGLDWILENEADVIEVSDLPFSKQTNHPIRLVLAVAQDSAYKEISDLQNKRIATELVKVTKNFLVTQGVDATVEYSYGATEVKVPKLVDAIAELTETGDSLRANGLRVIATILESTPRLHANKQAWASPWKREKLQNIAMLVEGALHAKAKVGLKMNVAQENINQILNLLSAMKRPTVSSLIGGEGVAIEVIMDEKKVRDIIPALKRAGAEDIIEYPLNKVIP